MSGQESRRHPETPPYRCFLSDLTGFAGLRRAGPTRTQARIPDVEGDVNIDSWDCKLLVVEELLTTTRIHGGSWEIRVQAGGHEEPLTKLLQPPSSAVWMPLGGTSAAESEVLLGALRET